MRAPPQDDVAEMNTDSGGELEAIGFELGTQFAVESSELTVVRKTEAHRAPGPAKQDQQAVGFVDRCAVVSRDEASGDVVVAGVDRSGSATAEGLGQPGALDEVGK